MTDPLGIIGSNGNDALARVGGSPLPAPAAQIDQKGPSFKELLMEELGEVNRLQAEADRAMVDLEADRRDDYDAVFLATRKADAAFQMLLQVRNKMMDAYNEVKQIRV